MCVGDVKGLKGRQIRAASIHFQSGKFQAVSKETPKEQVAVFFGGDRSGRCSLDQDSWRGRTF